MSNYDRLMAGRVAVVPRPNLPIGSNTFGPPYGSPAALTCVSELQTLYNTVCRSYIAWSGIEATQGVRDWTNPDLWINSMITGNILPLMQVIFTPAWAVPGGVSSDRPFADVPVYPSANFTQFCTNYANWMTVVVQRYGHTILYELWNEVFCPSGYWREGGVTTAGATMGAVVQLYTACYTALKAADPLAKLCTPSVNYMDAYNGTGTPGVSATVALLQGLQANGITPDAVGAHPYTSYQTGDPTIDIYPTPLKNSFIAMDRLQKAMTRAGFGAVPVWLTEAGYIGSTNASNAFDAGSEARKAQWVREIHEMVYYLWCRNAVGPNKAGVELFCYYDLENYSNGTIDTSTTGMFTGTPVGGPHTQLQSGTEVQTFLSRLTAGSYVPTINTPLTLTGSTTGTIGVPQNYTATGSLACSPVYKSFKPSIATIDSVTGTLTPVAAGTTLVYAYVINTTRTVVYSNVITLTVT